MDFLKTLLVYMTLLTTLSVQEGPLPQDVPMPTATPVVTSTFAPFNTQVPTATPSPTPAPMPEMTPNSRYETLRFNDRSNDVKRLQKRLIELGYMPAGSADGAFGYQTYNAVRDFQKANGLSADGVAGPATLTQIYENPRVLPKTTPTQVPTATPTPTLEPIPTPRLVTPAPTVEATIVPPVDMPAEPEASAEPAAPAAVEPFVLTQVPDAMVISGNTGRLLTITQLVDGAQTPMSPPLWQNQHGEAVISLRDLADCYEGWTMQGSEAEGRFTVQAAGYEMQLLLAGGSVRVTVDGRSVTLDADDVRCQNGQVLVTGDFLSRTLDANVIYDAGERSLVLFIRDKSLSEAND